MSQLHFGNSQNKQVSVQLTVCVTLLRNATNFQPKSMEVFYYYMWPECVKREQPTLDFVVDVGGTLGCNLLNYVHRGPIVAAHTLIVMADPAVRSSRRKVWAIVVAADAVPLRHSQSVEGHRGRLLALWDTAVAMVPPQHRQQNDDDQKEDYTARGNPHEQPRLRATAATGVCLSFFGAGVCREEQKWDKKGKEMKG